MDRFKEARDRGGAYLVDRQHPDGSFDMSDAGLGMYFTIPVALQVSGHSKEASRCYVFVST